MATVADVHVISMVTTGLRALGENLQQSLDRVGVPIVIHELPDADSSYGRRTWWPLMSKKIGLVHDELQKGHITLWTDADVVFRRDPREDLLQRLEGHDVVFARSEGVKLCAGFFIAAPTRQTMDLLDPKALTWPNCGDQGRLRAKLKQQPDIARVGLLPLSLYPGGREVIIGMQPGRLVCHYNMSPRTAGKIDRMKEEGDWLL